MIFTSSKSHTYTKDVVAPLGDVYKYTPGALHRVVALVTMHDPLLASYA